MFGLFAKKVPHEARAKLRDIANEAFSILGAQVTSDTLSGTNMSIRFSDPAQRGQLRSAVVALWTEVSADINAWKRDFKANSERLAQSNPAAFDRAAFLMVSALLQTDFVCKVALEYPADREFGSLAFKLLASNMAGFDHILYDRPPTAHEFDPSPSTEILQSLPHANRFFESKAFEQ